MICDTGSKEVVSSVAELAALETTVAGASVICDTGSKDVVSSVAELAPLETAAAADMIAKQSRRGDMRFTESILFKRTC